MTTDRPDTTEGPFTVDAGRVQIETNIFGYSRSRPDKDGHIGVTPAADRVNPFVGMSTRF